MLLMLKVVTEVGELTTRSEQMVLVDCLGKLLILLFNFLNFTQTCSPSDSVGKLVLVNLLNRHGRQRNELVEENQVNQAEFLTT